MPFADHLAGTKLDTTSDVERVVPTKGDIVTFTFAEVGHLVGLDREWHRQGFEKCEFELRSLQLDEALALRTCWPPCERFDSGRVTHDGNGEPVGARAPSSGFLVMACSKNVLDLVWPSKYRALPLPGDDLVAMDGNHRLAALARRRAEGHRDELEIQVYLCHAVVVGTVG